MKMKIVFGAAVLLLSAGTANAQGINLSGVVSPLVGLANVGLPALNPVLQPILTLTGPMVGTVVQSLHPTLVQLGPVFTVVETVAGAVAIPALPLPGLP
jgi:hypothetical protein